MTGDPDRPVVLPSDVELIDGVLGDWLADRPGINAGELRGALIAAMAEHRYMAYEWGLQDGRRIVGNVVKEALHDEGLL